jgi:hypothetical protein
LPIVRHRLTASRETLRHTGNSRIACRATPTTAGSSSPSARTASSMCRSLLVADDHAGAIYRISYRKP